MYVWYCMINNVILGLSKTKIAAKRTPMFGENDHGSWDSRIACSCRRILWVRSGSPFRSGHIVLGEGSLGKKHEGIVVCSADFLYCLIMFNHVQSILNRIACVSEMHEPGLLHFVWSTKSRAFVWFHTWQTAALGQIQNMPLSQSWSLQDTLWQFKTATENHHA